MQIIKIEIAFPSGMTIPDTASMDDSQQVHVSERLLQLLREVDQTEAPPVMTVSVNGQLAEVRRRGEIFEVYGLSVANVGESSPTACARLLAPFLAPTKDQRQQFGRFLHTISAASLAGAVGYWHSTIAWTTSAVLNELGLAIAFVVTFYRGMVSMNGE